MAGQGEENIARREMAGPGMTGRGTAWKAWLGKTRQDAAQQDLTRHGSKCVAWPDWAEIDLAGPGIAWLAWT